MLLPWLLMLWWPPLTGSQPHCHCLQAAQCDDTKVAKVVQHTVWSLPFSSWPRGQE